MKLRRASRQRSEYRIATFCNQHAGVSQYLKDPGNFVRLGFVNSQNTILPLFREIVGTIGTYNDGLWGAQVSGQNLDPILLVPQ
jgi:hypothetical protein